MDRLAVRHRDAALRRSGLGWTAMLLALLAVTGQPAAAQRPEGPSAQRPPARQLGGGRRPLVAQAPAQPARGGMVQLNLQPDVQLRALIDLVSQRLNINFIYNADLGNRKITVRAPNEIPASSLLTLLSSVLRMEGLLLVDADVPGWKRIVDSREMVNTAQAGQARDILAADGPAAPVTQVFVLKNASATEVATTIRPFLSKAKAGGASGASVLAMRETNMLVVTDYAPIVLIISRLIELIDMPAGEAAQEFYTVQYLPAQDLAERVGALMGADGESAQILIVADPRTNQIVVAGPPKLVSYAVDLLKRFDVSLGLTTRVYRFQNIQAERFDRVVKSYLSVEDQRLYSSSVDAEGNLLIVRAAPEIHQRIDELRPQIDIAVPAGKSPIRFYKLKNANALDVLYTLLSLQEAAGTSVLGGEAVYDQGFPADTTPAAAPTPATASQMGALQTPATAPGALAPGMIAPGNLLNQPSAGPNVIQLQLNPTQTVPLPLPPAPDSFRPYDQLQQARLGRLAGYAGAALAGNAAATLPGGARVSADPTTNSLVIVAPPETQEMYRSLIERLDQRSPQVLIDAKIIAVDTTNNFRLGVEVSGGDRIGLRRMFAFTSYGLSEVDPITGALRIIPRLGFNGTVVDPYVADVVVQALASHSRARVLASPRILVNDNRTGQLESVVSVPFASLNSTNVASSESLGGNQQAGTIVTVTPHINENDHLSLEFEVEFSTFTSTTDTDSRLPPPRQIDRVGSVVTIPDGQTVIVGGLKRVGTADSYTGIPFIEKVPILKQVTGLTTEEVATTSFFLFLRPVILRDDRFADLKFFSEKSAQDAEIKGEHPKSLPVIIE